MDGNMAVKSILSFFGRALRASSRSIISMAVLSASALPAMAESTCVLCSDPEAAYECNAYASDPIPDRALALFCTKRIAGDYGHKTCSVEKNNSACMGLPVHFPFDPNDSSGFEFTFKPLEEDANAAPATLSDFAKESYDASKETVKQTGEAIGSAGEVAGNAIVEAGESIGNITKNTLKCIEFGLSDC